ncbi:MAG: C25 family cysteine peptidase, partial [Candidatus Cloacimonadota bacterium]
GGTVDARMPVDLYYGCLDGTWNGNNNQIWGETYDNVDMTPELHVGRFPAESLTEFNNIFRKIRYYVDTDTFSNNISIMFGENLNNDPVTWGGDYKDDVAQYIPETYFLRTHYQRDGTYSESIVWNAINQGANVMNHMGHANETFLLGQGNNTIEQLQNTEYGFLYSQGCYPAAFDQRTSGDGESIGEHLLTAYGALMGFIGNTRYGWYMPGGIDGASQFYDRQYFQALYNQGILELGKALTYSRLQNLNSALTSDVMRWCYYEQVLFGDPSISVKFPDLSLPLLSLESYSFDDVEGDGDGNISPGELIRFHPVIQNHPEWGPAHDVHVQITGLPVGSQILSGCPVYDMLIPGATTPSENYVRIQLPSNIGYGTFTFKVALNAFHPQTGLSVGVRTFEASFDITLMDSRFPWDCQVGSKSAPIVYPFNSEEGLDIAYLDSFGRTWLVDNEGENYLDFAPAEQQNIMRSTAMGNLDNNNLQDMVIASRTGAVYAVDTAGNSVMNFSAPTSFLFTPVLADFTGDGRHEIILGGLNGNIYVISPEGTLLPGFPLDLGSTFNSELAVASFDNGQSLDIIAACVNGNLYRISSSGQILPGFPVNLGSSVTGSPGVMNAVIYAGTNTQFHKILPDGSIAATASIAASPAGGAVFGNIIYNDKLDLAFVTINGMLYAMDEDLALLPGFPVNLGENFTCPPLLADLAGDGRPEIVLHSYISSVHVRLHNGESLDGFPFTTSYNGATPGTLVDFDDNGFYKLVSGYSTGIMMVNLQRPVGETAQWATYRGSLLRQGSMESTGVVGNAEGTTPGLVFGLLQNYPNPFNNSTTIDYKLSQPGRVSLEIYNLRGQLVRSLVNDSRSVGIHSANWDGRDENGRNIASGVYLYRLTSPEGSQTRRMLIVK